MLTIYVQILGNRSRNACLVTLAPAKNINESIINSSIQDTASILFISKTCFKIVLFFVKSGLKAGSDFGNEKEMNLESQNE